MILKHLEQIKPDVISLHNIHGGYFETRLLKKLSIKYPLVWTIHDMWSFTGNAAHTFGNLKWSELKSFKGENKLYPQIGLNIGRWLIRRKKHIYKNAEFYIAAPSKWIFNMALQTPLFKGKKVNYLPNGIDLEEYHPNGKGISKINLGIATETPVLFLFKEWINEMPAKGGAVINEILQGIERNLNKKAVLIAFGRGEIEVKVDFKKLSVIDAPVPGNLNLSLNDYYNCADLLLYFSKADTLPNTIMEAMASGCACAAFDIGGINEMVQNNHSGLLIKPFDKEEYIFRTVSLLNDRVLLAQYGINARKKIMAEYDIKSSAFKYYGLFNKLIDERKND